MLLWQRGGVLNFHSHSLDLHLQILRSKRLIQVEEPVQYQIFLINFFLAWSCFFPQKVFIVLSIFFFSQKPPCSHRVKSVKPEFHSDAHKELPCFMALLPNITCLQCWDMIWDKARKHRNKSHSPSSLRCSCRLIGWGKCQRCFQLLWCWHVLEERQSCIFF